MKIQSTIRCQPTREDRKVTQTDREIVLIRSTVTTLFQLMGHSKHDTILNMNWNVLNSILINDS